MEENNIIKAEHILLSANLSDELANKWDEIQSAYLTGRITREEYGARIIMDVLRPYYQTI